MFICLFVVFMVVVRLHWSFYTRPVLIIIIPYLPDYQWTRHLVNSAAQTRHLVNSAVVDLVAVPVTMIGYWNVCRWTWHFEWLSMLYGGQGMRRSHSHGVIRSQIA